MYQHKYCKMSNSPPPPKRRRTIVDPPSSEEESQPPPSVESDKSSSISLTKDDDEQPTSEHIQLENESDSMTNDSQSSSLIRDDSRHNHPSISGLQPHNQHVQIVVEQNVEEALKPEDCYVIKKSGIRHIKKFKSKAIDYEISFIEDKIRKCTEEKQDVFTVVLDIFQRLIDTLISEFAPQDRIIIEIHVPGSIDRPIWVPLMKVEDVNVEKIQAAIEKVQQSNQSIKLEGLMEIHVLHINVPTGEGYTEHERKQVTKWLKGKRSILSIEGKDLCLARALVTAKARIEKDEDKSIKWESIRKGLNEQEKLAKDLHSKAGVEEGPCSLEEIDQFQKTKIMEKYQIIVVPFENYKKCQFIYKGPRKELKLYILHYDNHYDVINSMSGLLDTDYFCEFCFRGFKTWEHHRCMNICTDCFNSHREDCQRKKKVHCKECDRTFKSERCESNHKKVPKALARGKTTKTVCKRITRCEKCRQAKKDQHKCGEIYCSLCKSQKPKTHDCYMQTIRPKQSTRSKTSGLFIFFDFECRQDMICTGDESKGHSNTLTVYKHIPNFCVAQRVCASCLEWPEFDKVCGTCNNREQKIFKGETTVSAFCEWLLTETNSDAIAIAHNMKGYDGHFVLSYLTKTGRCPDVLMNGSKIMRLTIKSEKKKTIKLIDSFNFIPMRLANFPKTFGVEEQKGYFPHRFNQEANEDYEGKWPEQDMYCTDEMTSEDRDKFAQWYKEQKDKKFCFQKEILKYCKGDVDLLRRGCGRFRALLQDLADEDPFEKCITIASVAMRVFQTQFLEENKIALIRGTKRYQKQSAIAIKWLKWMEKKDKCEIQHVFHKGEKKILQYRVDGFCKDTNKVYEFYGCYWHGCPKCCPNNNSGPGTFETTNDAYKHCLDRSDIVRNEGYELEEIWECDYEEQLRKDKEMKYFIDQLADPDPRTGPLIPQEAFYGGRTNATKLYHKVSGTDKIRYIDVCSLYPWVNKYGKYPIGHPKIIQEDLNVDKLQDYEGLIKCTVLPPFGLLHPVLPYRVKGKLLFPLCRTCAEEGAKKCIHNQKERQLRGTWVTDEVKKAVEMGYQITEIREVWHFEETSKDTGSLFSGYVNRFLKVKQESEGWPPECNKEEERRRYIDEYKVREGIELNYHDIQKNPGKRMLAKLMLNSLWGKFGQRNNPTQTKFVKDIEELYKMFREKRTLIENIRYINDDQTAEVQWRVADEYVQPAPNTNIFIAAYTTAQARLKLYSYLEELDDRVLYFDTDSIIYISKDGEYNPPTGSYLGDMTDELEKDYGKNSYIDEFVSAGPKNYAYKVISPTSSAPIYVCKVKGFSLNHSTSKVINFQKIKDIVLDCNVSTSVRVPQSTIQRKRGNIVTQEGTKMYRLVYEKRVLLDDLSTIPFGYLKQVE